MSNEILCGPCFPRSDRRLSTYDFTVQLTTVLFLLACQTIESFRARPASAAIHKAVANNWATSCTTAFDLL